MRISKDTAKHIAKLLCEKFRKEYEVTYEELREYVLSEYEKQIPKDILAIHKKHPEYFTTTSTVLIDGHGFSHFQISTKGDSKRCFITNYTDYKTKMKYDKKVFDVAQTLLRKYEAGNEKYKSLLKEVEVALITLQTTKRIEEKFPEAKAYLPTSNSLALVVDYSKLRKKIA